MPPPTTTPRPITNAKNTLAVASIVASTAPHVRGGSAGGMTRTVIPSSPGGRSNIEVHAEFVRVRAHADGVDLVFALVLDPVVDHVRGEHVAGEQEVVVVFERVAGGVEGSGG